MWVSSMTTDLKTSLRASEPTLIDWTMLSGTSNNE